MILYHFTGLEYLDAIMEDGLSIGDVPTSSTEGKTGVWFTTDQDPAGHGLGVEMDLPNGRQVANKQAVRITVSIPSSDRKLVPWMKWGREHCNPDMFAGLNRSGFDAQRSQNGGAESQEAHSINAYRGDDGHIREATVKSKYEFLIPAFRPDISESPLYFRWMLRNC